MSAFEVEGEAYDRGLKMGAAFGKDVEKLKERLDIWFGHLGEQWLEIAVASLPLIERYCPTVYAEMRGMQEQSGIDMEILAQLMCEREVGMLNAMRSAGFSSGPKGKPLAAEEVAAPQDCTGLLQVKEGTSLLAHSTDLEPAYYCEGEVSKVVRSCCGSESVLCINFAGIGALAGLNSSGVGISRFTVDNGERALLHGVPVYALLREALTLNSLDAVVNFFRDCPRTIPYAFNVVCPGLACSIELSPTQFTVKYLCAASSPVCFVRANHFRLDPVLIETEIGAHHLQALEGAKDKSSKSREASLEKSMNDHGGKMSVEDMKSALLQSPVMNETTMFSFVMDPGVLGAIPELHLQSYPSKDYVMYSCGSKSQEQGVAAL